MSLPLACQMVSERRLEFGVRLRHSPAKRTIVVRKRKKAYDCATVRLTLRPPQFKQERRSHDSTLQLPAQSRLQRSFINGLILFRLEFTRLSSDSLAKLWQWLLSSFFTDLHNLRNIHLHISVA